MRARRAAVLCASLLLGLVRSAAPAAAQGFRYDVFRTTVSVPYVAQVANAQGVKTLINGRLTNRHFVNLAQGRDPVAAVPGNEILVVLNPDDYIYERNARFAIFDKSTKTVITTVTQVDDSVSGYGKPDGSSFFLYTRGSLLDDLTSARFSIGRTSISGSAKGRERSSERGNRLTSRVTSMVGILPLTIEGQSVPAVILNGRVRVFGKALASLDGF